MEYITNTLGNLVQQTAFLNLTWGNYIMIAVACFFLYLAIKHGFEPLLLVPIAFGMLLVNIYPDIMLHAEDSANGTGGLLYYFFQLDEWSILPSLIFMGVGAMTDFGPLIANPASFLLGAAAQFGIFAAYLGAMALGFSDKAAAAISIIGGADGPTSIFLAGKLQPERARTRASHIIAINVHVVDTDSGIRVIYPIKYERNANQPKTSEYSPSWHHYPSGGTDRKTGTPGTQDSGQDPWSPEHSKHYPLQPW